MNYVLEVRDGLLRREVKLKPFHQFLATAETQRGVCGIEFARQVEEIEEEASVLPQNEVGLAAELLEFEIVPRIAPLPCTEN